MAARRVGRNRLKHNLTKYFKFKSVYLNVVFTVALLSSLYNCVHGVKIGVMHYGSHGRLGITCNRDELILISSEVLGYSRDTECNPRPMCSVPYTLAKWYCRGKSSCSGIPVERRPLHKRTCGSDFTNCLRVEYHCVKRTKLLDVCQDREIHHTTQGYITSPSFPDMYPPDQNCTCNIYSNGGTPTQLRSIFFLLKASQPCHDWIKVKTDGHTKGSRCGYNPREVVFHGRDIELNFRSDGHSQEMGFWMEFRSTNRQGVTIKCGSPSSLLTNSKQRKGMTTMLDLIKWHKEMKLKKQYAKQGLDRGTGEKVYLRRGGPQNEVSQTEKEANEYDESNSKDDLMNLETNENVLTTTEFTFTKNSQIELNNDMKFNNHARNEEVKGKFYNHPKNMLGKQQLIEKKLNNIQLTKKHDHESMQPITVENTDQVVSDDEIMGNTMSYEQNELQSNIQKDVNSQKQSKLNQPNNLQDTYWKHGSEQRNGFKLDQTRQKIRQGGNQYLQIRKPGIRPNRQNMVRFFNPKTGRFGWRKGRRLGPRGRNIRYNNAQQNIFLSDDNNPTTKQFQPVTPEVYVTLKEQINVTTPMKIFSHYLNSNSRETVIDTDRTTISLQLNTNISKPIQKESHIFKSSNLLAKFNSSGQNFTDSNTTFFNESVSVQNIDISNDAILTTKENTSPENQLIEATSNNINNSFNHNFNIQGNGTGYLQTMEFQEEELPFNTTKAILAESSTKIITVLATTTVARINIPFKTQTKIDTTTIPIITIKDVKSSVPTKNLTTLSNAFQQNFTTAEEILITKDYVTTPNAMEPDDPTNLKDVINVGQPPVIEDKNIQPPDIKQLAEDAHGGEIYDPLFHTYTNINAQNSKEETPQIESDMLSPGQTNEYVSQDQAVSKVEPNESLTTEKIKDSNENKSNQVHLNPYTVKSTDAIEGAVNLPHMPLNALPYKSFSSSHGESNQDGRNLKNPVFRNQHFSESQTEKESQNYEYDRPYKKKEVVETFHFVGTHAILDDPPTTKETESIPEHSKTEAISNATNINFKYANISGKNYDMKDIKHNLVDLITPLDPKVEVIDQHNLKQGGSSEDTTIKTSADGKMNKFSKVQKEDGLDFIDTKYLESNDNLVDQTIINDNILRNNLTKSTNVTNYNNVQSNITTAISPPITSNEHINKNGLIEDNNIDNTFMVNMDKPKSISIIGQLRESHEESDVELDKSEQHTSNMNKNNILNNDSPLNEILQDPFATWQERYNAWASYYYSLYRQRHEKQLKPNSFDKISSEINVQDYSKAQNFVSNDIEGNSDTNQYDAKINTQSEDDLAENSARNDYSAEYLQKAEVQVKTENVESSELPLEESENQLFLSGPQKLNIIDYAHENIMPILDDAASTAKSLEENDDIEQISNTEEIQNTHETEKKPTFFSHNETKHTHITDSTTTKYKISNMNKTEEHNVSKEDNIILESDEIKKQETLKIESKEIVTEETLTNVDGAVVLDIAENKDYSKVMKYIKPKLSLENVKNKELTTTMTEELVTQVDEITTAIPEVKTEAIMTTGFEIFTTESIFVTKENTKYIESTEPNKISTNMEQFAKNGRDFFVFTETTEETHSETDEYKRKSDIARDSDDNENSENSNAWSDADTNEFEDVMLTNIGKADDQFEYIHSQSYLTNTEFKEIGESKMKNTKAEEEYSEITKEDINTEYGEKDNLNLYVSEMNDVTSEEYNKPLNPKDLTDGDYDDKELILETPLSVNTANINQNVGNLNLVDGLENDHVDTEGINPNGNEYNPEHWWNQYWQEKWQETWKRYHSKHDTSESMALQNTSDWHKNGHNGWEPSPTDFLKPDFDYQKPIIPPYLGSQDPDTLPEGITKDEQFKRWNTVYGKWFSLGDKQPIEDFIKVIKEKWEEKQKLKGNNYLNIEYPLQGVSYPEGEVSPEELDFLISQNSKFDQDYREQVNSKENIQNSKRTDSNLSNINNAKEKVSQEELDFIISQNNQFDQDYRQWVNSNENMHDSKINNPNSLNINILKEKASFEEMGGVGENKIAKTPWDARFNNLRESNNKGTKYPSYPDEQTIRGVRNEQQHEESLWQNSKHSNNLEVLNSKPHQIDHDTAPWDGRYIETGSVDNFDNNFPENKHYKQPSTPERKEPWQIQANVNDQTPHAIYPFKDNIPIHVHNFPENKHYKQPSTPERKEPWQNHANVNDQTPHAISDFKDNIPIHESISKGKNIEKSPWDARFIDSELGSIDANDIKDPQRVTGIDFHHSNHENNIKVNQEPKLPMSSWDMRKRNNLKISLRHPSSHENIHLNIPEVDSNQAINHNIDFKPLNTWDTRTYDSKQVNEDSVPIDWQDGNLYNHIKEPEKKSISGNKHTAKIKPWSTDINRYANNVPQHPDHDNPSNPWMQINKPKQQWQDVNNHKQNGRTPWQESQQTVPGFQWESNEANFNNPWYRDQSTILNEPWQRSNHLNDWHQNNIPSQFEPGLHKYDNSVTHKSNILSENERFKQLNNEHFNHDNEPARNHHNNINKLNNQPKPWVLKKQSFETPNPSSDFIDGNEYTAKQAPDSNQNTPIKGEKSNIPLNVHYAPPLVDENQNSWPYKWPFSDNNQNKNPPDWMGKPKLWNSPINTRPPHVTGRFRPAPNGNVALSDGSLDVIVPGGYILNPQKDKRKPVEEAKSKNDPAREWWNRNKYKMTPPPWKHTKSTIRIRDQRLERNGTVKGPRANHRPNKGYPPKEGRHFRNHTWPLTPNHRPRRPNRPMPGGSPNHNPLVPSKQPAYPYGVLPTNMKHSLGDVDPTLYDRIQNYLGNQGHNKNLLVPGSKMAAMESKKDKTKGADKDTVWVLLVLAIVGWLIFMVMVGLLVYYKRERMCRKKMMRRHGYTSSYASSMPKHLLFPDLHSPLCSMAHPHAASSIDHSPSIPTRPHSANSNDSLLGLSKQAQTDPCQRKKRKQQQQQEYILQPQINLLALSDNESFSNHSGFSNGAMSDRPLPRIPLPFSSGFGVPQDCRTRSSSMCAEMAFSTNSSTESIGVQEIIGNNNIAEIDAKSNCSAGTFKSNKSHYQSLNTIRDRKAKSRSFSNIKQLEESFANYKQNNADESSHDGRSKYSNKNSHQNDSLPQSIQKKIEASRPDTPVLKQRNLKPKPQTKLSTFMPLETQRTPEVHNKTNTILSNGSSTDTNSLISQNPRHDHASGNVTNIIQPSNKSAFYDPSVPPHQYQQASTPFNNRRPSPANSVVNQPVSENVPSNSLRRGTKPAKPHRSHGSRSVKTVKSNNANDTMDDIYMSLTKIATKYKDPNYNPNQPILPPKMEDFKTTEIHDEFPILPPPVSSANNFSNDQYTSSADTNFYQNGHMLISASESIPSHSSEDTDPDVTPPEMSVFTVSGLYESGGNSTLPRTIRSPSNDQVYLKTAPNMLSGETNTEANQSAHNISTGNGGTNSLASTMTSVSENSTSVSTLMTSFNTTANSQSFKTPIITVPPTGNRIPITKDTIPGKPPLGIPGIHHSRGDPGSEQHRNHLNATAKRIITTLSKTKPGSSAERIKRIIPEQASLFNEKVKPELNRILSQRTGRLPVQV